MRWHPDRPHNSGNAAEATEMFQMAKEAYDFLLQDCQRPRRIY